jgi:hypothetical protein
VAKPGAPVLEARKLLDRVQKPEVDEAGDDGFLLSVTEDGQSDGKQKLAPGVLAASKLVPAPTALAAADISDEDLWEADESPIAPSKPGRTPAAPPANKPSPISDEDLPDLYEA